MIRDLAVRKIPVAQVRGPSVCRIPVDGYSPKFALTIFISNDFTKMHDNVLQNFSPYNSIGRMKKSQPHQINVYSMNYIIPTNAQM